MPQLSQAHTQFVCENRIIAIEFHQQMQMKLEQRKIHKEWTIFSQPHPFKKS